MKILYLDCNMGAAGDMLTAALLELLEDPSDFVDKLNSLGIPGVEYKLEKSEKCGITGAAMHVLVHGHEEEHHHSHDHHERKDAPPLKGPAHTKHHHNGIKDIEHIISDHLSIPKNVKEDVLSVYKLIAEAESKVHGVPVTDIHFHEVGTMDAIADVVAVCMLMDKINPDEVISSPIHVGSGHVHCAHGILPVPAPATAHILKNIPVYGGKIEGELCTPTGAALLKYFVTRFDDMPVMKANSIGYGMGKKDFEIANCVRIILGETEGKKEYITQLECNVDDMTGEEIGFVTKELFLKGAKDVYTVPIGMKKSRPGILISVICKENDKAGLVEVLFKHTSTLGVRENKLSRYVLERTEAVLDGENSSVRIKRAKGYGTSKVKIEYEDLAEYAKKNEISLREAKKILLKDLY